jgi:adenylate cyclase
MGETRKIAAILVADVVGYSRLAGADEDRTLSRLRGLRSDLIDPAIAAHHGRIVKRTGDGLLVEFRSVVDAVRCAIEMQTGLIERNAGLAPERRIKFRVGVHLGDVVEEADGDLMGDGVNIAARLEAIAAPGAICLSEDAYRQVRGRLDLAAADLGPTQLKNIAEPIRVYSLQVGAPAEATPAKAAAPEAPNKRSSLAAVTAVIVALAFAVAAGAWYVTANRAAPVAPNAPSLATSRLSIVVLPFANLSGDPAQDYLADALTDELTTGLARIPRSFVIARNTAFTYKGKTVDAKAIGRELGVRYVLEGSVQPSGGVVRVNAQLIDADSSAHVWAEQFDTPRTDLLQMQDEIVTHLARGLELQLPEVEAARLKRTPAANPSAEDLALRCIATAQKNGFAGREAEAGYRLCQQALDVDPDNARALSLLSVKFVMSAFGRGGDPEADLKRADELDSRALALDPNFAPSHLNKANILYLEGRTDEAAAEAERALALDPAMVDAYTTLGGVYSVQGQYEKSLESYDKMIRLSPHDPRLGHEYGYKADAYFGLKQYEQAIEWARRAIATTPENNPLAYRSLIAGLALTGRADEAREALQRYLALTPSGLRTISAWKGLEAGVANRRGDPRFLETSDRAIEGLRKAGMPEE